MDIRSRSNCQQKNENKEKKRICDRYKKEKLKFLPAEEGIGLGVFTSIFSKILSLLLNITNPWKIFC